MIGVRSQQLPLRLQQRRRRRLRRGHRRRQPGDRQGQHLAPGHHAAVRRSRRWPRPARPGCPTATVQLHLSHRSRDRQAAGGASAGGGHRLHRRARRPASRSRRRPTRPASPSTWSCRASTRWSCCPGALRTRGEALADEFTGSCLMGTGPVLHQPRAGDPAAGRAPRPTLHRPGEGQVRRRRRWARCWASRSQDRLAHAMSVLTKAGAAGADRRARRAAGRGYSFTNTLLRSRRRRLPAQPGRRMQEEAFGNASLLVVAEDAGRGGGGAGGAGGQPHRLASTPTPPAATTPPTPRLAPILRRKVGRLLNDKMPTGVAVSPAMNHGGPYPADRAPGLHRRRHPGVAAPVRRCCSRSTPSASRACRRCCRTRTPAARPGGWSTAPSPRGICRWAAWSPSRLIALDDGTSRALLYPERGFQLFGYQAERGRQAGRRSSTPRPATSSRPTAATATRCCSPRSGCQQRLAQADHWDHEGASLPMPPHGWARNVYWQIDRLEARVADGGGAAPPGFPPGLPLRLRAAHDLHAGARRAGAGHRAQEHRRRCRSPTRSASIPTCGRRWAPRRRRARASAAWCACPRARA